MPTRATISLKTIAAAHQLTVGEMEQLREFIHRHPELLPERGDDQYDMEHLSQTARMITKQTRKLK